MFKLFLPVTLLVVLGACSGSSSLDDTGPISSNGFASAENVDAPPSGATITLRQTPRILSNAGQNLELDKQTIVLETEPVGDDVFFTLNIDGERYELAPVGGDNLRQRATFDGSTIELRAFLLAQNVAVSELFVSIIDDNGREQLNDGWVVYGLDTNPVDVAALSGEATYSGRLEATLRQAGFGAAIGEGDFDLSVSFENGTVGGSARVTDRGQPNATFDFEPIDITLQSTSIVGNGFSGGIAVDSDSFRSSVSGGGYQGNFFGLDAAAVGGTAQGRLTATGDGTETFMVLGFVANRDGG